MEFYRQSVVYSPQPREYRRDSPHLPTPETSRSSNGSLDEQIPRTYTRNGMRICSLLTNDQPDRVTKPRDRTYHGVTDGRHRAAPQSPPYHDLDSHKPSLPPLKTVLNGTITSPPNTPPSQHRLFQPGPREPAFSACTYKPPALYPNKKPRTEGGLDPSPTFQSRSNLSSPGAPTALVNERRESFYQAPTLRQEHTYPSSANYHHSRGRVDDARSRPGAKTANGSYRSPEMATYPSTRADHSSSTRMRTSADYFPSSSTDRYALPSERPFLDRRPSGVNALHHLDTPHAAYPPSRSPHYSLPLREDSGAPKEQSHYADRGRIHAPEMYNRLGYEEAQPTFFMPSHYDYQQGKTRKRSNLPKQSTEIMKTWFDQNITNPYPSEDQKAVFSNATGISMTQVSNWFINHRRRCPELRDKRDKTRVGGLDGGD